MVVIKAYRRRRVDLRGCGEFTKQDMAEINEKPRLALPMFSGAVTV
jgi:hypothetical protein